MQGEIKKLVDGNQTYTYPITVAEAVYVDAQQNLKSKLAELEASQPSNNRGGSYVVELSRWGINNDGTNADTTSEGLNAALIWASEQGFTEVVLPNGIYLIDEQNPIEPPSYITLNLNNSTLKIRPNRLPKYAVILIDQKTYVKIVNGKIEGDRHEHNYTRDSTHEFGVGVHIMHGATYITLDQLDIYDTTGDAVITIASYGGIGGRMPGLAGNFEPGGINTRDGSPTNETNRIRSSVTLPMDVPLIQRTGYFGLYGDSFGGLGREITTDLYDVIFYRENDSFLSSQTDIHFFDEVIVPNGASYAKVVLHQGTVPSPAGNTITVRSPEFPHFIFIERCRLHHCRRLGIAVAGAKHLYIRACDIFANKGVAPQGGIDIEDGYDLNQYIHIDSNNIYDNGSYNIVVVNGRHITITNNRIATEIFSISRSVDKAVVSGNYFSHAGPRINGDVIFADNNLYACRVLITDSARQVLISNCYFHNSPIVINKTKAYSLTISNSTMYNDQDFAQGLGNMGASLSFFGEPQSISNCVFEGHGIEAFTAILNTTSGGWHFSESTFINIIHPENRITKLPAGTYSGCHFINSGRLTPTAGQTPHQYEFHNCTFTWNGYALFYINTNLNIERFRFSNCSFNCDGSNNTFFINGQYELIDFTHNTFNYSNSSNFPPMIEFVSTIKANAIIIEGNRFLATKTATAVTADQIDPLVNLLYKDNLVKNASVNLRENHTKLNNFSI